MKVCLLFLLFVCGRSWALSPELGQAIQKRFNESGEVVSPRDSDFKKALVKISKVLKMTFESPWNKEKIKNKLAHEFLEAVDNSLLDPQHADLALFNFYYSFVQKKELTAFLHNNSKTASLFREDELYDPTQETKYLEKMRELGMANDYLKIKVRESRPKAKNELARVLLVSVEQALSQNVRTQEELRQEIFNNLLKALFVLRGQDFMLDEGHFIAGELNPQDFLQRAQGCFFTKHKEEEIQTCASRLSEEVPFWLGRAYLLLKSTGLSQNHQQMLSVDIERKALALYDECSHRWYFDRLALAYSGRHLFEGRVFAKTCLRTALLGAQYVLEQNKLQTDFAPFFEAQELERQVNAHLDVLVQCTYKNKILKSLERENNELKFSWDAINQMSSRTFQKEWLGCQFLFEEEVAKYLFPRVLLKDQNLGLWIEDKKERVRLVQESLLNTLAPCLSTQKEKESIQSKICFPLLQLRLDQLLFETLLRRKIDEISRLYFADRGTLLIEKSNRLLKEELKTCQEKELKTFLTIEKNNNPPVSLCARNLIKKISLMVVSFKAEENMGEEGLKKLSQQLDLKLSKALEGHDDFPALWAAVASQVDQAPILFFQVWAQDLLTKELKTNSDKITQLLQEVQPAGFQESLQQALPTTELTQVLAQAMAQTWQKIAEENAKEHISSRYTQKNSEFQNALEARALSDFKACLSTHSWKQQMGRSCMQVLSLSLSKHGNEQSSLDDLALHFLIPAWFPPQLATLFAQGQARVERSWVDFLKTCPESAEKKQSTMGLKERLKRRWVSSTVDSCGLKGQILLTKELSREIGGIYLRYLLEGKNSQSLAFFQEQFNKILDKEINEEFFKNKDEDEAESHWLYVRRLYLLEAVVEGVRTLDPYKDQEYIKNVGQSLFSCLISSPEMESGERKGAQLARQNTYVKKCMDKVTLDPGTIDKNSFTRQVQVYNSCLYQVISEATVSPKKFEDCRQGFKFTK